MRTNARRSYRRTYRRRHRSNPRRRHYRRNPALFGFTIPPLDAIGFTAAGLLIPPVVQSYLMPYLPASLQTSRTGTYLVKAASVLLPSMLVRRFVSRRAGNLMLLGGAASFVISLINDFAPNLLPGAAPALKGQPFVGFYERMPSRLPAGGMGRYASIPVRSVPLQRTPLIAQTPDRLSPAERF